MGKELRVILVTGCPRSGTTAVGKMLSLGRSVCALHEPFNYHVGIKEVERYFEVPGTGLFPYDKLDSCVRMIRNLDLDFKKGVFPNDSMPRKIFKYAAGGRALNSFRLCRMNPFLEVIVWKDPFACFMAEYLSKEHNMNVLVTLRNPWAVSASFKRMRWAFDLKDIIGRLAAAGHDFSGHLELLERGIDPCFANGAVIWNIIYSLILQWSSASSLIRVVDIDRILGNPQKTYEALYHIFGLPWNDTVSKKITMAYAPRTGRETPREKRAHDGKRDLKMINDYWRSCTDGAESDFVQMVNGDLWERLKTAAGEGPC